MKTTLYALSGKIGSGKDLTAKIINWLIWKQKYYPNDHSVKFHESWYLKESDNCGFEIKKFAYKLKQIVALLTGCTVENLEDQEFKNRLLPEEWNYVLSGLKKDKMPVSHFKGDAIFEGNPNRFIKKYTYRDLLQQIGTESMRVGIHQNIWVNALFSDYNCSCGDSMTEGEIQHVEFEGCNVPNWIITDCRFQNEAKAIKERGGILIRINRPTTVSQASEHPSETSLDDYQFDHVITNDGSVDDLINKVAKILEL